MNEVDRARTDSAGQPWKGRSFPHGDTPFGNDDGSMPQEFEHAMRALEHAGDASAAGTELRDVVDALRETRLLVPLLAEAGELGLTDTGRIVDKTQELSVVQVAGPDGAPITPMFSCVAAMQRWNPAARPVPIDAQRAAAAALTDSGRVVIDPGSWSEIVLSRDALLAIMTGEAWVPAWQDADVLDRLTAPIVRIPGVRAVVVEPHDPRSRLQATHLVLRVVPRLDAAALSGALADIGADEVLVARVVSVGVTGSDDVGAAPPGATVVPAS